MKKTLLSLCALLAAAPTVAATGTECPATGLIYEVRFGDGEARQLEVWRRGRMSAWVNAGKHITDIWDHPSSGAAKLTRHYDEARRAVEYQAGEAEANTTLAALDGIWLQGCQMVRQMQLDTPGGVITWTLTGVEKDAAKIDAVFSSRERYQSTDFIDIGDNETDAFLRSLGGHGHSH